MTDHSYLMESDEEIFRLELKTDEHVLKQQALWAGIKPGMRVADIGCGPGKTTAILNHLAQPRGVAVGVDGSQERIAYATEKYAQEGARFECKDIYGPLEGLGQFDFIWSRFFLEYHRARSFEIIGKLATLLKPGGILCLVDLDNNCLNHFGFPARLDRAIRGIMDRLERESDFDPYLGRKLYSYLYDLDFKDIRVSMTPHHLIYGELNDIDAYNWTKKALIAGKESGYRFEEYGGGFEEFLEEFETCFADPRRFTYTPLICCRGRKVY